MRLAQNSVLTGLVLFLGSIGHAMAQNTIGNIYNNQGVITQGQHGNNTIIQGPIARHLSDPRADPLRAQILREVPKDRPITVMAVMGDAEAMQFALEIHSFMKESGFQMREPEGISQGVFTGPVKGLTKQDEADGGITFVVGANMQ
jgi:hypothetical protein